MNKEKQNAEEKSDQKNDRVIFYQLPKLNEVIMPKSDGSDAVADFGISRIGD